MFSLYVLHLARHVACSFALVSLLSPCQGLLLVHVLLPFCSLASSAAPALASTAQHRLPSAHPLRFDQLAVPWLPVLGEQAGQWPLGLQQLPSVAEWFAACGSHCVEGLHRTRSSSLSASYSSLHRHDPLPAGHHRERRRQHALCCWLGLRRKAHLHARGCEALSKVEFSGGPGHYGDHRPRRTTGPQPLSCC